MTVDYDFYVSSYGGSVIPAAAWQRISTKAGARLDKYTFCRIGVEVTNLQKCALCEMAEAMYQDENRGNMTSESNDGYSVSYDTSRSIDETLYSIASAYLLHTGIMDLAVDNNAN